MKPNACCWKNFVFCVLVLSSLSQHLVLALHPSIDATSSVARPRRSRGRRQTLQLHAQQAGADSFMRQERGNLLIRSGVLADIQHAPIPDGTSFSGTPRYYRNALRVARVAAEHFEREALPVVLNLGDIVDGKCQDLVRYGGDALPEGMDPGLVCTDRVLDALSPYRAGNIIHAYGNHCLYNMDRESMGAKLGIPFVKEPCGELVGYHSVVHNGVRFVVLDCYDIAKLRRPQPSEKYQTADTILRRNNPNYKTNDNSPEGLEGLEKRFVAFNGAVGSTQLEWLRDTLEGARKKQELVVLVSHLPILPGSSNPVCLLWNYDQVLKVIREYRDVIAISLSGHAHKGGYLRDSESGIHFRVVEAVLENPSPDDTYAMMHVYGNRVQIIGLGNCESTEYELDHLNIDFNAHPASSESCVSEETA